MLTFCSVFSKILLFKKFYNKKKKNMMDLILVIID